MKQFQSSHQITIHCGEQKSACRATLRVEKADWVHFLHRRDMSNSCVMLLQLSSHCILSHPKRKRKLLQLKELRETNSAFVLFISDAETRSHFTFEKSLRFHLATLVNDVFRGVFLRVIAMWESRATGWPSHCHAITFLQLLEPQRVHSAGRSLLWN